MKRIGRCFIAVRGDGQRLNEYEILRSNYDGLLIRYVGYRQGDVTTGLPFSGPNAVHMQTLLPFEEYRNLMSGIKFFKEEEDQ